MIVLHESQARWRTIVWVFQSFLILTNTLTAFYMLTIISENNAVNISTAIRATERAQTKLDIARHILTSLKEENKIAEAISANEVSALLDITIERLNALIESEGRIKKGLVQLDEQ